LIDLTLRELPRLQSSTLALNGNGSARRQSSSGVAERELKLRDRMPPEQLADFDNALLEAKAAYGLHDEDVRIAYLWPLGLMRRALLAAAGLLIDDGLLAQSDHIFQTTPAELDALLAGSSQLSASELAERVAEFASWKDEKLPPSYGIKEAV